MIACVAFPRTIPPRSTAPCCLLVTSLLHTDSRVMNSDYDFSMCGLCQHIVRPPPSPIFGSLPWQFTFVHPLLDHTWTKHSSRTVLFPLEVSETTIPFGLLRLAEQLVPCSTPVNALARLRPFAKTVPTAPFRVSQRAKLVAHFCRLRMYPFHVEEKVLMLHGTEFRSLLRMVTNTPSSVYKPLHEYRILRVSNFPHLCELCTTSSIIT
ncbi:hypothetical protein BHE74_00021728 [Ensete ventricosum]|nr:hypothetical protein BHE74_00021728 [Ensete ventricosum]